VRISRLQLHDFRGWTDLELQPRTHVLLAGVPRAGRSDVISALTRLLDPASIRVQPALSDIRQQRTRAATGATMLSENEAPAARDDVEISAASHGQEHAVAEFGEAEVTLVDLDPELAQLCDGFLEPLDGDDQVDQTGNAAPDAPFGVRLSYRVSYDTKTDSLEHVVFFSGA
jgi:putative ATP-dependent endonuclease of OLD family